jgi:hypothetical protein
MSEEKKEFLCPHHNYLTGCGHDNKVYRYEGFIEYEDYGRHSPYRIVDHCKTCGVKLSEEKAKILA